MIKKAFVILLCVMSCAAFANTCESELTGNVASFLRLIKESMRSTGAHSQLVSNSQLERMTTENIDPLSSVIADSTNAAKAAFARLASSLSFEQRQQVLVEVARMLQESHSSQQIIQKARDFTAPVLAPQAFEAIDLKGNFGQIKPGSLRLHKNVDGKIWAVVYSMPNGRWATELNIFSFDNLQSRSFTHQKYNIRNERKELYGDSFGNLWLAGYAGTRLNLQNLSTNESLPEHNVQLPIQEVTPFRDLTGSMRLATVQKTNRRDIDEYQLEILKVDAGFESQLVIPFESGSLEYSKTPSGEMLATVISPKRKLQVWNLTTLNLVTEWDYNYRGIFVGTKTYANRQGQVHVAVKDFGDDRPTLFFKSGERDPIMALGWDWTSTVNWYETNNGRLFAILTAESQGKLQDKSAKLRLFEPFNPATQQVYKNRFDRFVNFFGFDSGASRLQTNPLHELHLQGGRQSFGIHRHSAGRLLLTRGSNDFHAFTIDEQKGELVSAFQFNRASNRNDYFVTKFSAKNGRLYGAYNFENNKIAVSEFSSDGMSSTNQVVFETRGAWALIDDGDQIYVANLIGSKLQFATIFGRAE